jgi:YD repeat-containing protein
LRTLNYANGVAASYSYDQINRLQDYQVTLDGANILHQNFSYDKNHNITAITEGTKVKTYDYDANNQLTRSITPASFWSRIPPPGAMGSKSGIISALLRSTWRRA